MDTRTQDPTAPGVSPETETSRSDRVRPDPTPDEQTPRHAVADLKARVSELAEYVSYLLSAKFDGIKLTFRNIAVYAALGVVGLIAAGAVVVSAVVLVCVGIAGGLSALFGDRPWQGALVAGLLLLAVIGAGVWIGLSRLTKSSRERTVQKYAARQQQQRAKFGRDVHERADEPAK
jgi:hypothetical protein